MNNNTTGAVGQQVDSIEQIVELMENTAISKRKLGFLDLPAEIRNDIYGPLIHIDLPTAAALFNSCRQVRYEYRPLYFRECLLGLPFGLLPRFLKTLFPADTVAIMDKYECWLKVDIATSIWKGDRTIDVKWLSNFIHQSPRIRIFFEGRRAFDWEAEDLEELYYLIQDNVAWRNRLADFESITLPIENNWYPGQTNSYNGYYVRRPTWELKFVLKAEVIEAWGSNEVELRKQTRDLVCELGLLNIEDSGWETKTFNGIKIIVDKNTNRWDKGLGHW
ncbi:Nn.00g036180.m01.CDS01 [Neocucurbitaria sp. VM-36]